MNPLEHPNLSKPYVVLSVVLRDEHVTSDANLDLGGATYGQVIRLFAGLFLQYQEALHVVAQAIQEPGMAEDVKRLCEQMEIESRIRVVEKG